MGTATDYWAKSANADGRKQSVREHLEQVSSLAATYGEPLGLYKQAKLCGLLHDFGKYSEKFQGVLRGTHQGIDHAICGAALTYRTFAKQASGLARNIPVIEAINGHHAGLMGMPQLKPYLAECMCTEVQCNKGKESALSGEEFSTASCAFLSDFPHFQFPSFRKEPDDPEAAQLVSMLTTRMLFSCLVDADYSASAEWEHPGYLAAQELPPLDAKGALAKLLSYRNKLRWESDADGQLNAMRDRLFEQCGEMGERESGLFTLTAPTGTGKTLALLHFALRHCIETGKKRIIIVLPFLTLAEQSTAIYRQILPEVLEDHSQSNLDDAAREHAARWNAPCIITTSVRFFESLFADRPTDCRKLHHLADSVILFDESQSLPAELTAATLHAVKALCTRYQCTMVFSSATQPAFRYLPKMDWQPTEILPNNAAMFHAMRRTAVKWDIARQTPLTDIAQEMAQQDSTCTIVNLRRHAVKLYRALRQHCPADTVFFLTTDLCPAHRSAMIARIHARQAASLPCRVVATQCIEAGVDLDFDSMYRALAPFDAIIQAAGRCNRNGKNPQQGWVTVFVPDEDGGLYPDNWYGNAALIVKIMSQEREIDIHDPQDIERYYQMLFRSAEDKRALSDAIEQRNYTATAAEYKLIDNHGVCVIVPFAAQRELYERVREQALAQGLTPALMKQAAAITVTTFQKDLADYTEPLCFAGRKGKLAGDSGWYVLCRQEEFRYTEEEGLQFPQSMKMGFVGI